MSKPYKPKLAQEADKAPLQAINSDNSENLTDPIAPEVTSQEPDAHDQLVEKALENPDVQAAYDAQAKEFSVLEEKLKQQLEVETKAPAFPKRIKMLTDFRIEYPLPCRRDASMSLRFKKDQEVTDKYIIKHLLQNPASPIAIEE
jgi:hypothetical protein